MLTFEDQLKTFNSLGYHLNEGVTKEILFRDVYEINWDTENPEEEFQKKPFVLLYYLLGWRGGSKISYNYTDNCVWFDLEFFDSSSQYKWFMERMGKISRGKIQFENIEISIDPEGYERIKFKVNGIHKDWKLEKPGFISDSFIQRFSYLPSELNIEGKFTYFDDGGQQFIIDFATVEEQREFHEKTGITREWLGEGNHFSEPGK